MPSTSETSQHNTAEYRDELHGRGGERGDIIHGVLCERRRGPFGSSACALLHIEGDAHRFKADPRGKRAEKGVPLAHIDENVDRLPVEQLEVRGVRHVDAGRAADERIERSRRETDARGSPRRGGLLPLDDLVALLPQAVHLHDLLRRVLEIAVDHNAAVAFRRGQPREDRRFLAEIPGKMQPAGCRRTRRAP